MKSCSVAALVSAVSLAIFTNVLLAQPPGAGGPGDRRGRAFGPLEGGPRNLPNFMGPLMEALDADNDGDLSPEEIANAVKALKRLDGDADGKLSREELRPRFPGPPGPGGSGRPGGQDFIQRLMRFDRDGDGRLTKEELPEPMRDRILDRADANDDGVLDAAELKKMQAGPGTRDPEPPAEDVGKETATHVEVSPLEVSFGTLESLRLRADGNLVAADSEESVIKVVSPEGKVIATIEPGFRPKVIAFGVDGTLFCGGEGFVAELGADGQVVKKVELPKPDESNAPARRAGSHPPGISGLAVSDESVFVTFGSGWSVGAKAKLFAFDRDLESPRLLGEGLRACCQHCDIACRDGVLFVAENSAYRVVTYDREGEVVGKWGSKSRDDLKLFGGCCNPMNIALDAGGTLYTAESGLGRVKRYTADGEFLGLVGYLDVERFTRGGRVASSCCHMPIAVTPEGDRVYVTDVKENIIRVLEKKPS